MIDKIAIFRALQLGDMLNIIPAVRSLRRAYPEAEITLLGLPWAAQFVRRFNGYFDRFIHFPGYTGLPEQEYDEEAFRAFAEEMRARHFDLLLQMQGNGTIVNEMVMRFGAGRVAGFHNKDSRMASPYFVEYPEGIHEIRRHQALMTHLGIPLTGDALEFPLTARDQKDYERLMLPLERGRYVVIHPGSRGAWRQWPPAYFALVADHCAERGFDLVITGTPGETEITREVMKRVHHPMTDLTGCTTLGSLGVLLRGAALLVANCTGVSHVAAALRTPSLVISMDGEPYRWGPLDHSLHKTIDWIASPSHEQVFAALEELIPVSPAAAGRMLHS